MASSLVGCNLESGFRRAGTELFDPDVTFIGRPERLVEGEFSDPRIEASLDTRRTLVALDDRSELTLVPLDEGELVRLGPVLRYGAVRVEESPTLEPMLVFLDASDGSSTLRFASLEGNVSAAKVDAIDRLRRRVVLDGPDGGTGLEVVAVDGRVVYVDPWQERVEYVLCQQDGELEDADCGQRALINGSDATLSWSIAWLQEEGFQSRQLIARGLNLVEGAEARFGTGVVDFQSAPLASDGESESVVEECPNEAAQSCRAAFAVLASPLPLAMERIEVEDTGQLQVEDCPADAGDRCSLRFVRVTGAVEPTDEVVVQAADAEPIEDACVARYHRDVSGVYVSYFSPCAGGGLYLQKRFSADDTRVEEPPCLLDDLASSSPLLSAGRATYLRRGADGGSELYTQVLLAAPAESTDSTPVACGHVGQVLGTNPDPASIRVREGLLTALVDFESGIGNFVAWRSMDEADPESPLAPAEWRIQGMEGALEAIPGVVELSLGPELAPGVNLLARFDGEQGELLFADLSRSPLRALSLAEGVPRNAERVGMRGVAAITEIEAGAGQLYSYDLVDDDGYSVDDAVSLGSYNFAALFDGLVYLKDVDSNGLGTLNVSLANTRDVFSLSAGVREWREVGIPSPGILFTVERPTEQAGVWFAPAR